MNLFPRMITINVHETIATRITLYRYYLVTIIIIINEISMVPKEVLLSNLCVKLLLIGIVLCESIGSSADKNE